MQSVQSMVESARPTVPSTGEPAKAPFDPRQFFSQSAPRPPSDWLEPPPPADDREPVSEAEPVPEVLSEEPLSEVAGSPVVSEGSRVEEPDPASEDRPERKLSPGVVHRGRRLVRSEEGRSGGFTPEQRLLVLDSWRRSGLPAGDFAPLVGVTSHTLYAWKYKFEQDGPAGLMNRPRGKPAGSRLSEVTKRAIIMMKESNPDWGVQRISSMLERGPGLAACPNAVGKVLQEWGYELQESPTQRHPDKIRRFERAAPNQMWQTDLFTFVLKRQNQRVYLVAFLDDHSRFVVGFGLHASQSAMLAIETLRAAIASYGTPEEVLTDNGTQYVTWRGTSQFALECQKRGIKQIVASPRHPQTLGKTERFWGTLWRECLGTAVFADMADARQRIAHFIDHYNFQRPHQGIDHLTPADRFFGAAPTMLSTLKSRVAANALDLARQGSPKAPFYLAGNVNGQPVSVHAAGDRLLMTTGDGTPVEVTLAANVADEEHRPPLPAAVSPQGVPASAWRGADGPYPPGVSPVDAVLAAAGQTPEVAS